MRLFTAIELSPEQRQFLAGFRSSLAGAVWVPPDNYHITLRFVGEVNSRHLAEEIDFALSRVESASFTLQIGGIGVTTGPKSDRVWVGVERNDCLVRLQTRIESALRRSGLTPDTRKFMPHITLGHLPCGTALERWMQLHNLLRPEPLAVSHFTLFRSHLGTDAPHYEYCADYPLARPLAAAI